MKFCGDSLTSGQPLPGEANHREDYWERADMMIQKGNNDFLIEFLKIERREENGRERKIKDRCFSSGGVEKPDTALQLLWKQG
jgi:hypothetical protein